MGTSSLINKLMLDAGDVDAGRRLVGITNQNYKNAVERLAKRYGGQELIPPKELAKIENLFLEPKMFQGQVDDLEKKEYSENLKSIQDSLENESLDADIRNLLERKREELISNAPLIIEKEKQAQIDQENKSQELIQAQVDSLETAPDLLKKEMERYAGILGLPDAEERKRDKTTAMLLGLGSSISNATDLGDIGKSFPSIFNAMQGIDKTETKDKMGILNLLATQQKTNTLSRKDQIKALNDYLTSRQKALEMPGADTKTIEAEIKQIEAALSSMLGTKSNTTQSLTDYLKG